MRVAIRGHNLPGRQWDESDNVHVGLQERRDPVGLVPGDADAAGWDLDVRVVISDDGDLDFRGPAVHGKRGERFLYLTWGDVDGDGGFAMFRRAKLMLHRIERTLVEAADQEGTLLLGEVDLTDGCGGPRCGRLDPPDMQWSTTSPDPQPRP